MAKLRKDLAWLVQVEDRYGIRQIVARIVIPQESGELNNPSSFMRFDNNEKEFADFNVTAYLGNDGTGISQPERRGEIWGLGRSFTPHHIEHADHARDMNRMLTKIDKGLSVANTEMGYLADGDFAGYLGRIGKTLGITTIYVRNSTPFQNVTGERWRNVDMGTLQYWLREVSKYAATDQGKINQMIRG